MIAQNRSTIEQKINEQIKVAIITGNLEALKMLVEEYNILYQPIDANNLTMLHYAVQNGKEEIVKELALQMFYKDGINVVDKLGRTPLHQAAAKGNIPIMKTLILLSSDVNSTTISGETPLMKAIAFYQPKAVNLLLRYGANPFLTNIVVRTNMSAISQGIQLNNTDIVQYLRKYEDVFKKIALVIYVYNNFGNTEKKSCLNNLQAPLFKQLIKYIIP